MRCYDFFTATSSRAIADGEHWPLESRKSSKRVEARRRSRNELFTAVTTALAAKCGLSDALDKLEGELVTTDRARSEEQGAEVRERRHHRSSEEK